MANIDDVRPQFATPQSVYLSQNAIFNATLVRANGVSASASVTALNGSLSTQLTSVDGMKQLAKPWYSDQILPFDQVLRGGKEKSALACARKRKPTGLTGPSGSARWRWPSCAGAHC